MAAREYRQSRRPRKQDRWLPLETVLGPTLAGLI